MFEIIYPRAAIIIKNFENNCNELAVPKLNKVSISKINKTPINPIEIDINLE